MKHTGLILAAVACLAAPLAAQQGAQQERTRISGLAFGDAYWMANNHDPTFEGQNGFWLRRAYLTFDHDLRDDLALRLRFEVNSPGDFSTPGKLEPFIKDLYARFTVSKQQFYVGISSSPTWDVVEKVWGYRAVEKTPLDLFKFGSSRDFGIALKGRFDPGGIVRYHLQLGNGAGTKAETNQGKKAAMALGFYPVRGLVVQFYGDYEDRDGQTDRVTGQAFVAYQTDRARAGVQVARQHRELAEGGSVNLDIASAFAVVRVHERAALLARYDRTFDPMSDASKVAYLPMDGRSKCNLAIFGVDLTVAPQFHVIPNLEAVVYDTLETAERPDADVMVRTTFYVTF